MTIEKGDGRAGSKCLSDLERLRGLTCIKWTRYPSDVIPAWVADMDLPPAPVTVDAVDALVQRGDFGYNMLATSRLPEVFSQWQSRRHRWEPDARCVRLFCDVMQGMAVSLWLGTDPGDGVVLLTPTYPPFFSTIKGTGRRVVECPLDREGWRLDPERLASVVDEGTRAIVFCNPHNPTGRVFDATELAAIASIAERHDLLVLSDEIWGDLVHPGAVHVPFALVSDDAARRTVTVTAASKAFNVAGLHCAVAHVGHGALRKKMNDLPPHVLGAVGTPGAEATLAAWTRGEPWLGATRQYLTEARDHAAARLSAELPRIGFTVPDATYLAWLDVHDYSLGEDPAAWLLEHARVALSSGNDFGVHGEGFVRMNMATSMEILDLIIDRMVAALADAPRVASPRGGGRT
jgi:cystathionine beta-lyase